MTPAKSRQTALRPLLALNFFMADMRAGIGPFLGVFPGAVMIVQGVGASISPAIGGWIAQERGYGPTFLILGAFSAVSVGLWMTFASLLKPACAGKPERSALAHAAT